MTEHREANRPIQIVTAWVFTSPQHKPVEMAEMAGVRQLMAEHGRLESESEALQKSYADAWEKARALQSECDEFAKDAERYRWLRDKAGAADWEYVGYQSPETTDGEIDQWMKERPNG